MLRGIGRRENNHSKAAETVNMDKEEVDVTANKRDRTDGGNNHLCIAPRKKMGCRSET